MKDKRPKIMIVDDEENVRVLVNRIVSDEGYETCLESNGKEALDDFSKENPDLIILDIMMPGFDGFEVCKQLRARDINVPIIFLSAKDQMFDKSMGFNAGGDDYLVKPFSPRELLLRIYARLQQHSRAERQGKDRIAYSQIELDSKHNRVLVEGKPIELTSKEFQIIQLLASHPGEVFSRDQIIEHVWGDEFVGETTSVAVFVRRIREKIENDPSHPRYLQTVWRNGYKFENQ